MRLASTQNDDFLDLVAAVLGRTFRRYGIRSQDRQDVIQEVAARILWRLPGKTFQGAKQAHYIRKSARLDGNKICAAISLRRQHERTNLDPTFFNQQ